MERLVSRKEIEEFLGVSRVTVFRLMKEGMPRHKLGYRTIRFDIEEVREWLKTRGKRLG